MESKKKAKLTESETETVGTRDRGGEEVGGREEMLVKGRRKETPPVISSADPPYSMAAIGHDTV